MDPPVERDLAARLQDEFAAARANLEALYARRYQEELAAATQAIMATAQQTTQTLAANRNAKHATPTTFSGRANALLDWLFKLELYLAAVGIPQTAVDAVTLAVGYLDGAALTWWRYRVGQVAVGQQRAVDNWTDFRLAALTKQFRTLDEARTARDRLRTLRQLASVRDYAQRFQTLLLDLPTMHEDDRVWAFCAGLKPNVRVLVELARPKDLLAAIQVADTSDSTLYLNKPRATGRTAYDGPASMELGAMAATARPGSRTPAQRRLDARRRLGAARDQTQARCYHCNHVGHYARACPLKERTGNARA